LRAKAWGLPDKKRRDAEIAKDPSYISSSATASVLKQAGSLRKSCQAEVWRYMRQKLAGSLLRGKFIRRACLLRRTRPYEESHALRLRLRRRRGLIWLRLLIGLLRR
jgi:hypothetical protein